MSCCVCVCVCFGVGTLHSACTTDLQRTARILPPRCSWREQAARGAPARVSLAFPKPLLLSLLSLLLLLLSLLLPPLQPRARRTTFTVSWCGRCWVWGSAHWHCWPAGHATRWRPHPRQQVGCVFFFWGGCFSLGGGIGLERCRGMQGLSCKVSFTTQACLG